MKLFILGDDATDEEASAMLQPEHHDTIVRVPAGALLESLAVMAGAYPSKGQARRSGFCGPVPWGLDLYGSGGQYFFAWSPHHPAQPPTISKRRRLWRRWVEYLDVMCC